MKKLLTLLLLLLTAFPVLAQTPDAELLADINRIKAIDNHAHVMSVGPPEDEEFDAIACGKLEFISPPPLRLRIDNPIYTGAWRALYGYPHGGDMSKAKVDELIAAKRRLARIAGDNVPRNDTKRHELCQCQLVGFPSTPRGLPAWGPRVDRQTGRWEASG